MTLRELIQGIATTAEVGNKDITITSLGFDSRSVESGQLFFAIKGSASDGHIYITTAIEKGAVAIICEQMPEYICDNVTYIVVADSSITLGHISSAFYNHPSHKLQLIGITGTNGKTTTATLLYDLFRLLGYKTGLISTVTYKINNHTIPSTHTTPDSIRLNAMLAEMVDCGCQYCFMEVSSHSVVQQRIAGIRFTGGVFTNITHDHLDYHGTFAEYIRAKKGFFDTLSSNAFALVNSDDRNGLIMVQNTSAKTYSYALQRFSDYSCKIMENTPEGMLLELDGHQVWTRFMGKFNAYNLTAVYGTARLLGAGTDETLRAISNLNPVDGRFDTMLSQDKVTAIVDYAHTPDALKNVIETINELRQGNSRLFVVVGCGGDRDKTKRPVMAQISTDGADLSIFTSDNPRHEEPEIILDDMTAGLIESNKWLRISDRRQAIKTAATMAHPGDFILIAGKGHETYQIIGDHKDHFDDKEEIKKFLNIPSLE